MASRLSLRELCPPLTVTDWEKCFPIRDHYVVYLNKSFSEPLDKGYPISLKSPQPPLKKGELPAPFRKGGAPSPGLFKPSAKAGGNLMFSV